MLHRSPARSLAVKAAAWSGLGAAGIAWKQRRGWMARANREGFTIEPVTEWGGWADPIWERFRTGCSFAVCRDRRALETMYDLRRDARLIVLLARKNGEPVGWTVNYLTAMRDSAFFGNLKVGSVLDGAAGPEAMRAIAEMTDRFLASLGANLVITNQTHRAWVEAYGECGFLAGPSNYVAAVSKKLVKAVSSTPDGAERIHITRGDGDGRIHL